MNVQRLTLVSSVSKTGIGTAVRTFKVPCSGIITDITWISAVTAVGAASYAWSFLCPNSNPQYAASNFSQGTTDNTAMADLISFQAVGTDTQVPVTRQEFGVNYPIYLGMDICHGCGNIAGSTAFWWVILRIAKA